VLLVSLEAFRILGLWMGLVCCEYIQESLTRSRRETRRKICMYVQGHKCALGGHPSSTKREKQVPGTTRAGHLQHAPPNGNRQLGLTFGYLVDT
jgi:hypothetical protein